MLSVEDWNKEFVRLNGIPPSRMDLSSESTRSYFLRISAGGGYKMPGVIPPSTPEVTQPVAVTTEIKQAANPQAKELITRIKADIQSLEQLLK